MSKKSTSAGHTERRIVMSDLENARNEGAITSSQRSNTTSRTQNQTENYLNPTQDGSSSAGSSQNERGHLEDDDEELEEVRRTQTTMLLASEVRKRNESGKMLHSAAEGNVGNLVTLQERLNQTALAFKPPQESRPEIPLSDSHLQEITPRVNVEQKSLVQNTGLPPFCPPMAINGIMDTMGTSSSVEATSTPIRGHAQNKPNPGKQVSVTTPTITQHHDIHLGDVHLACTEIDREAVLPKNSKSPRSNIHPQVDNRLNLNSKPDRIFFPDRECEVELKDNNPFTQKAEGRMFRVKVINAQERNIRVEENTQPFRKKAFTTNVKPALNVAYRGNDNPTQKDSYEQRAIRTSHAQTNNDNYYNIQPSAAQHVGNERSQLISNKTEKQNKVTEEVFDNCEDIYELDKRSDS
jgi:hypothetical protein